MFKGKSVCEVKIGERLYQIICESDSPISEFIDVLNIVVKNAKKILDESSVPPADEKYESVVEGVIENV